MFQLLLFDNLNLGLDYLSNNTKIAVDWFLVDGRGVPSNLRITKHKSDQTDRGSGAIEWFANSSVDLGNKSYRVKGGGQYVCWEGNHVLKANDEEWHGITTS